MDRHKIMVLSQSWLVPISYVIFLYFIALLSHPFSFEFAFMIFILITKFRESVKKLSYFWVTLIVLSSCIMVLLKSKFLLNLSIISFIAPSAKFFSDAYASDFMSIANGAVFSVLVILPFTEPGNDYPNAASPSKFEILRGAAMILPLFGAFKINTLIIWLGFSTTPDRWGLALTNDVQTDPFVALLLAAGTFLNGAALGALLLINKQVKSAT